MPLLQPGIVNPSLLRATAALGAAWDATPLEVVAASAENVLIGITYIRGALNGAVDFLVEISLYNLAANVPAGAEEWVQVSALAIGNVLAGVDTLSRIQREYMTYEATGAGAEAFAYGPLTLGGAVERLRISARESGVPGTPGTCQIEAVFGQTYYNV